MVLLEAGQVTPPSVDLRMPMDGMVSWEPVPLASPVARYMIWVLEGSIAMSEQPTIGNWSVLVVQFSPPSMDFHKPPNGDASHMMLLLFGSNFRKLTLAAPG